MQKPDYIKLSVRSARSLHDGEAVNRRPRHMFEQFVTSWTWNFTTDAERDKALAAAQAKRTELQQSNPDISPQAFRLSTLQWGSIRGVPGVGFTSASKAKLEDAQEAA